MQALRIRVEGSCEAAEGRTGQHPVVEAAGVDCIPADILHTLVAVDYVTHIQKKEKGPIKRSKRATYALP
jgi:hypothetical protein